MGNVCVNLRLSEIFVDDLEQGAKAAMKRERNAKDTNKGPVSDTMDYR